MKKVILFLLVFLILSCNSNENNNFKENLNNNINLNTKITKENIDLSNKKTILSTLINKYPNEKILSYVDENNAIIGKLKDAPPNGTFKIQYDAYLLLNGKKTEIPFENIQNAKFDVKEKNIVYIVDKQSNLYKFNIENGEQKLLDESIIYSFDLSNDGTKAAYLKGEMPDYDLYVINLKTYDKQKLTENATPSWNPVFSEDNKEIIFVYSPEGFSSIWKISIDNKKLTQLTNKEITSQKAMECGECLQPFPNENQMIWKNNNLYFESYKESYNLNLSTFELKSIGKIRNLHKDNGNIFGTDENKKLQLIEK